MNAKDNVQRNRKLEVEKQKKKEAKLELQREKELVFSLLPHRFCTHSEKADD